MIDSAINKEAESFYRECIVALERCHAAFLIGGAYGFRHYTSIYRSTKDLDIFVRPKDVEHTLNVLSDRGYKTEIIYTAWLAKAYYKDFFVDIIFRSGNGLAEVDDVWFTEARTGTILQEECLICPPEETIWSKAFTMERERYDMADIVHLIQSCGETLDWDRLVYRFGEHWRVLLTYLILFGYIYPGHQQCIPKSVMKALLRKLNNEISTMDIQSVDEADLCKGTLLSGSQFLFDLLVRGYRDARFTGSVNMPENELRQWAQQLDDELDYRLQLASIELPPAIEKNNQAKPNDGAAVSY